MSRRSQINPIHFNNTAFSAQPPCLALHPPLCRNLIPLNYKILGFLSLKNVILKIMTPSPDLIPSLPP